MKKIEVSEATSQQLNWLVAKCEGVAITKFKESPSLFFGQGFDKYAPSTNWEQGGPIIEREGLTLDKTPDGWVSYMYREESPDAVSDGFGPTLLIAAMRCYVASKLGETAEVPEELIV